MRRLQSDFSEHPFNVKMASDTLSITKKALTFSFIPVVKRCQNANYKILTVRKDNGPKTKLKCH